MVEPFGGKTGARFGPGYPSCPDMALSRKIWQLSEAGRIGVAVTDSDMLEPEMSTSAVLAHRPRARIFNRLV
jgi:5-methyltetrahydrofolate--homocysteine methyltransferase